MSKSVKRNSDGRDDVAERILEGAELGGEMTRKKFAESITRRRFCEEVGIHRNTLKKWEQLGIVKPRFEEILKSRTAIYAPEDVERGKRIATLIADNFGTMSIKRAAEIVDKG